jgi:hypothetical protein
MFDSGYRGIFDGTRLALRKGVAVNIRQYFPTMQEIYTWPSMCSIIAYLLWNEKKGEKMEQQRDEKGS